MLAALAHRLTDIGAQVVSQVGQAASHAGQVSHQPAGELAAFAQRAELIDVDVTLVFQSIFFFTLIFVLPKLIFQPMLGRIEQREARTEGARAEAKAMRHAADDRVATYDAATADEKRRALDERAQIRTATQKNAADLIAKARAQSAQRLETNLAQQKTTADAARVDLRAEAHKIAQNIADKLAQA